MSRPPDALTFFVDVDLGIHFATELAADGRFLVEFHDRHFPTGTDDAVWLDLVAKNGWIAVTHDKKIKRHHKAIIAACMARAIIVVGARPLAEHAANFKQSYPRIARFVRDHDGPYTAKLFHPSGRDLRKLNPKGRIELWWP